MKSKRFTAIILTVLIALGALVAPTAKVQAAEAQIKVTVNGKAVAFPDAQPFKDKNGRIQVPVRFVSEALNCTVDWNEKAKTVTVTRGKITAMLTIDKKEIAMFHGTRTMDTAPVIQSGRTYVPLRFVAEIFGAEVSWNGNTSTASITDLGKDKYKVGDFTLDIEDGDELGITTSKLLMIIKKSGLLVGEESFRPIVNGIRSKNENPVLTIQIMLHIIKSDIPKQREEAEALLKQRISVKLADEIMAYAAMKQEASYVLPSKEYNEGRYTILVVGSSNSPITIMVYMN